MKLYFLLIALCAMQLTYAQKIIEQVYPGNKINEIKILSTYANTNIETYKGNEIIIEASVNINLNMDNKYFEINSNFLNGILTISSEIDNDNIPKRVIYKNKKGETVVYSASDNKIEDMNALGDNISSINYGYQTDITVKIKIPENKKISIESTYGDVHGKGIFHDIKADITYGDIEIQQAAIKNISNIELTSTYGHVDFSVNNSANITFDLSTNYGEIFSDLNVVSTKEHTFSSNRCGSARGGKYILNKGTNTARITATYDDIYLRKI